MSIAGREQPKSKPSWKCRGRGYCRGLAV